MSNVNIQLKEKMYSGKTREEIMEFFYDLFYKAISRRIIYSYEKKGEKILIKSLGRYGKERGRELREYYDKLNIDRNPTNLIKYFDFNITRKRINKIKEDMYEIIIEKSSHIINWKELGLIKEINMYINSVFKPLIEEYNDDIEVIKTSVNIENNIVTILLIYNGKNNESDISNYKLNDKPYLTLIKDMYDMMYGYIAKNTIEEFGAEGEQIIRRCIRDYGKLRGVRLKNKHLEAGLELNLFNLMDYYDIPTVDGYEEEKEIYTPYIDICNVDWCSHNDKWRDKGLTKEGIIYCEEVHNAFWTAYNPEIIVVQPKILTRNDDKCKFISKIPKHN